MLKTKLGEIIFCKKNSQKNLCQVQPTYFKDILTGKDLLSTNIEVLLQIFANLRDTFNCGNTFGPFY
jgi:hypothetical protein